MAIDFQPLQPTVSNKIDFQPVNQSEPSVAKSISTNTTGIQGKLYAGAHGYLTGAVDSAEGIGTIAHNLLKSSTDFLGRLFDSPNAAKNVNEGLNLISNIGEKGISAAKDYLAPQSEFEQNA